MLPLVKVRSVNSPASSIGSRARASHAANARVSTAPAASALMTSALPQRPARAYESHEAEHPGRDEGEAGHVGLDPGHVTLARPDERERDKDRPDRHVDPEDPLPGDLPR